MNLGIKQRCSLHASLCLNHKLVFPKDRLRKYMCQITALTNAFGPTNFFHLDALGSRAWGTVDSVTLYRTKTFSLSLSSVEPLGFRFSLTLPEEKRESRRHVERNTRCKVVNWPRKHVNYHSLTIAPPTYVFRVWPLLYCCKYSNIPLQLE